MAQKRELNDYCPRVQLQKLIDDCGKPELSYDTITHEDGSATVTLMDSNETMKKVLDKVDHFVDEFVGKDLRDEVVRDAKKQVELKVKAQMKIHQRKERKKVAAAKHVDDFDWERLATFGGLADLSVAELNMYLTEHCSMSVADIRKKGFGKKQKVKLIKENIMCGHSMSQNASASLKMTIPSKDDGESGSKPLPAVPPWGGSTIYNEKVVRLRNTCTIDNFLTLFHFICLSNPSIQSQRDLFYSRIIEVHKLFEAGDFALGKLHWLELLPQKVDLTHTVIDIFGNEFEYFISAMTDVLATIKTSFCSDSKCPKPTISSTSSEIILDVDKTQTSAEQDVFSSSVSLWLHNKAPTFCLRKHHPLSPACKGSRSHSVRSFIQGIPMVMPFNIDILTKNGLTDVNHLPDDIQINANKFITTYKLFGVTYGNGSHFRSAMHLPPIVATQPGWYEYDGLWEHCQRGTGLKFCGNKPPTPPGYVMSYALYIRAT